MGSDTTNDDPLAVTLAEAETRIRHQPTETVYVFDRETGACLYRAGGDEDSAPVSDAARTMARDNIILHNHPAGRNISEEDVRTLKRVKPAEFVIVTATRRLRWLRPDNGWPPNLMAVYRNHYRIVLLRLEKEQARGKITETEFRYRVYENANQRTVNELQIPYQEEPWNDI